MNMLLFTTKRTLQVLRWERYPGPSGWAQCNHKCPTGKQKTESREESALLGLKMGQGPGATEYRQLLEAVKEKKAPVSPQAHRGNAGQPAP